MLPKLDSLAKRKYWEFSLGINRVYDLSVLEYEFAFWQWGFSCNSIPNADSNPYELFKHWAEINPFRFFEDKEIEKVRPFFYQAMTQIGMYGYNI